MPIDPKQPDNAEFYERHWSLTSLAADRDVLGKAERLAALIPADVRTIADVGCGDGTITRVLAQRWAVTAVDRSAQALQRVAGHSPQVHRVQASAEALPFADREFDLVFCSEMLEHLPGEVLDKAARELQRVARRWLLLSVPNRENIRRRFLKCPKCQLEFNIYGHLHSLDAAALARRFDGFAVQEAVTSGPDEPPTLAAVERFRQRYGARWFWWQGAQACCPRCLNTEFAAQPWHLGNRLADKTADTLTRAWISATGQKPQPYWVSVLMCRRDAETGR